MGLKAEVTQAFSFLGITPDTEYSEAAKAYKKLALKYHPDKNTETNTTAQFQEVGSAWHICQRHYEQPELSQDSPFPDYGGGGFHPPGGGVYFTPGFSFFGGAAPPGYHRHSHYEDEDEYSDEDEDEYENEFFRFMFESVLRGKYSYASGQKYREQHPHHHHRRSDTSGTRRNPQNTQRKEKEEYEQRLKQFEKELEEDAARERQEAAQKEQSEKAVQEARAQAFQVARTGDGEEMKRIIDLFDLDVTLPRTGSIKNKPKYETLLHLASSSNCPVSILVYLVDKGADPTMRNTAGFTPFHSAVLKGNVRAVKWYLGLSPDDPGVKVKNKDGCHPGKVVGASNGYEKKTPLDLAMESGSLECVELMVKYATVHKVEAVWKSIMSTGEEIEGIEKVKKVLLTKNGFVPPPSSPGTSGSRLSRKEQENLEKEERKRVAEENRQKKEEKKRLTRLRAEEEEETRKAIALVEEQERKERERKKAEEERDWRMKEEQRVRREAEQKAARDAELQEAKERKDREDYIRREKERMWQEEQEKIRKQDHIKEEKRKQEEEARRKKQAEEEKEQRIRDELERKIRAQLEEEMRLKLQLEREKLQASLPPTPAPAAEATEPSTLPPAHTSKRGTRTPKPCRFYQRGYCRFKDRCKDLHEAPADVEVPSPEFEAELRSQQQTPEPRAISPAPPTPVAAAPEREPASELPSPVTDDAQKSTGKVCRFYARGKKCMYGSRCRNLHILNAPSSSDAPATTDAPATSDASAATPRAPRPPKAKASTPAPPKKMKTYLPSPTPSPGPEDIQTIPLVEDELFPVQRRSRPPPPPLAPSSPQIEPAIAPSNSPTAASKASNTAPPKRTRPPRQPRTQQVPSADAEGPGDALPAEGAPKKSRSSRKPFWMRKKAAAPATT